MTMTTRSCDLLVIGSGLGKIIPGHVGIRAIVIDSRLDQRLCLQSKRFRVVCNGTVKIAAILSIEPTIVVVLGGLRSLP